MITRNEFTIIDAILGEIEDTGWGFSFLSTKVQNDHSIDSNHSQNLVAKMIHTFELLMYRADENSILLLTPKGQIVRDTNGGFEAYQQSERQKEIREIRNLNLQISLSEKANKFFYLTTILGILGFVFSAILGIVELTRPSEQNDGPPQPLSEQISDIDKKSAVPPILEVDSSMSQSICPDSLEVEK